MRVKGREIGSNRESRKRQELQAEDWSTISPILLVSRYHWPPVHWVQVNDAVPVVSLLILLHEILVLCVRAWFWSGFLVACSDRLEGDIKAVQSLTCITLNFWHSGIRRVIMRIWTEIHGAAWPHESWRGHQHPLRAQVWKGNQPKVTAGKTFPSLGVVERQRRGRRSGSNYRSVYDCSSLL